MISEEYKAVFAHIDKTGGSSITSMLNNGGREETKYKQQAPNPKVDSNFMCMYFLFFISSHCLTLPKIEKCKNKNPYQINKMPI